MKQFSHVAVSGAMQDIRLFTIVDKPAILNFDVFADVLHSPNEKPTRIHVKREGFPVPVAEAGQHILVVSIPVRAQTWVRANPSENFPQQVSVPYVGPGVDVLFGTLTEENLEEDPAGAPCFGGQDDAITVSPTPVFILRCEVRQIAQEHNIVRIHEDDDFAIGELPHVLLHRQKTMAKTLPLPLPTEHVHLYFVPLR